MKHLALVGCGGHAREIIAQRSLCLPISRVFSEVETDVGTEFVFSRHEGTVRFVVEPLPENPDPKTNYILASDAQRAWRRLWERGFKSTFVVALASTRVEDGFGPGTVGAGSVLLLPTFIGPSVVIRENVHVLPGAQIHHDCEIGPHSFIGPGAILCGRVKVGSCSSIGAGAVVCPGVSIGADIVVGAGSVVIHNIADSELTDAFEVWAGVPARRLR